MSGAGGVYRVVVGKADAGVGCRRNPEAHLQRFSGVVRNGHGPGCRGRIWSCRERTGRAKHQWGHARSAQRCCARIDRRRQDRCPALPLTIQRKTRHKRSDRLRPQYHVNVARQACSNCRAVRRADVEIRRVPKRPAGNSQDPGAGIRHADRLAELCRTRRRRDDGAREGETCRQCCSCEQRVRQICSESGNVCRIVHVGALRRVGCSAIAAGQHCRDLRGTKTPLLRFGERVWSGRCRCVTVDAKARVYLIAPLKRRVALCKCAADEKQRRQRTKGPGQPHEPDSRRHRSAPRRNPRL